MWHFRNGDIIYVSYVEPITEEPSASIESTTTVKQNPVDDFLEKQRGLIDRKRDPKL